jgi:hypothetical protein
MIGKPYQIPIYILHNKSPDLVYLSFPFGFGIDDKTSVFEFKSKESLGIGVQFYCNFNHCNLFNFFLFDDNHISFTQDFNC